MLSVCSFIKKTHAGTGSPVPAIYNQEVIMDV